MKIVILALAAFLPVALASSAPTYPARHLRLPVVNQTAATNAPAPEYTFDQLFQLQKTFLDEFIYPENGVQVRSILYLTLPPSTDMAPASGETDNRRPHQAKSINASILAPNVQGRVDITRTFDGAELNTEYLFGLFANLAASPQAFTLLGIPTGYEITHFAASQNIASASTRYFTPPSQPPPQEPSANPYPASTSPFPSSLASLSPSKSTHGTPSTMRARSLNTMPPSNGGSGPSPTFSPPPPAPIT